MQSSIQNSYLDSCRKWRKDVTVAFNAAFGVDMVIEDFLRLAQWRFSIHSPPRTILDVGCLDGIQSVEFSFAFPEAKIYAFDCNPMPRPILQNWPNIQFTQTAISDFDGEASFFSLSPWPGCSSFSQKWVERVIVDAPQTKVDYKEITVPVTRIDTWAKKNEITEIDAVWMDVEGAELQALNGMGDLLQTVKAIYLEVSYKKKFDGQVLFSEIEDFLKHNKFQCVFNFPGLGAGGNAIFLNERNLEGILE